MNDEIMQKVDWRVRLTVAIIGRQFDDETLAELLTAGLDKAHSEGILDAAEVCQTIADFKGNSTASILAESLRDLDRRNMLKTRPLRADA